MAFMVVLKSSQFSAFVPRAVMSSGAVSPRARLKAKITPVRMPGRAVRTLTKRAVFHTGTPRASEASRIACGTSRSTSWVERIMIGSVRMESAATAAHPEKPSTGTRIR